MYCIYPLLSAAVCFRHTIRCHPPVQPDIPDHNFRLKPHFLLQFRKHLCSSHELSQVSLLFFLILSALFLFSSQTGQCRFLSSSAFPSVLFLLLFPAALSPSQHFLSSAPGPLLPYFPEFLLLPQQLRMSPFLQPAPQNLMLKPSAAVQQLLLPKTAQRAACSSLFSPPDF